MNFKDNLKKIRKDNNLSQEELAEKLRVSRQSVSKWEQGLAYPEMDKVLQICKMFNVSMDDLLNKDINKQEKEKKSKTSINKYIEDFLSFVTKSVDMVTNMSFKTKVKCILEQIMLILIEFVILMPIYFVFANIFENIIYAIPDHYAFDEIILSLFDAVYVIFSLMMGVTLLIHIFKVRYLDYYEIVKKDDASSEKEVKVNEKKQVVNNKKEKIIIRNANHSDYKFIQEILKFIILGIKCFLIVITVPAVISLITLMVMFVVSFMIAKTGIFFIGVLLGLISAIIINILIIIILFNFILNRKNNSKIMLIIFLSSLLLFGLGIGIGTVGFTEFEYINDATNNIYQTTEKTFSMNDNMFIDDYYMNETKYIEDNREDVKVVIKHSKYIDCELKENEKHYIDIYVSRENEDFLTQIRNQIKDINNKRIVNYDKYQVYVYASHANIEKMLENRNKYFQEMQSHNTLPLEEKIYNLEQRINDLENIKQDLENSINEKNQKIQYLQDEIKRKQQSIDFYESR